jgi:hypothetical protein
MTYFACDDALFDKVEYEIAFSVSNQEAPAVAP